MKKQHLKLKVSELSENPKNPKLHDDKRIKKSIKELGFIDDIVVDENNVILAGHGRLKALKDLDYKDIDVIQITGWTEEQKEKYLLSSNKLVELGGWDDSKLIEFDPALLKEVGFENLEEIGSGSGGGGLNGEVEFSEELMLEHNYVILYFDNPLDWNVAKEKLGLKDVKSIAPEKSQKIGIGRVIKGNDIINKL